MANNGAKKDWRNFEKRREEALKAGYGQSPPTVYPSSMASSSNSNIGESGYARLEGNSPRNHGGAGGTVPVSSIYPGQISASATAAGPFSYTHGYVYGAQPPPPTPWTPHENPSPGGQFTRDGYSNSPGGSQRHDKGKIITEEEFDGPLKKRKCRDVICLALFAVFMGVMAVVAGYALWTGDFSRIVPGGSERTCVDSGSPPIDIPMLGGVKISPNFNEPLLTLDTNEIGNLTISDIDQGFFDKLASQFKENWPNIVYMCLISLGLSILMTVFLRLFAGTIIWMVVGLFVVCSVIGTIVLWVVYSSADNLENGSYFDKHRKEILLTLAIIVSIITVLILLVLLILRKRIALVVRLFKEAGKAVHAVPLVLIQPIWTFLCQGVAGVICVSLAVLIETSEVLDESTGECRKSSFAQAGRYLNVFGYFWMTQFIMGCQHLVVAGAISQWFFTRDKSRLGTPLLTSIKNLVRYHLGSIAFGSAIIAVVKFLRYILNQIKNRLSGASKIVAVLLCCCSCCLWCLESFLTFLNRNAYIEIAIYGYGFCPAAKRAFKVITNNALRLVAINSIGDFVLFLAKLTIVGVTVLCGYYIFESTLEANRTLDFEWVLIVVGAMFAYYIAHCFISIYEMAIDTIFICFCEDCEMNDGGSQQYFMSKGLMEFVKMSNKADKKQKKEK